MASSFRRSFRRPFRRKSFSSSYRPLERDRRWSYAQFSNTVNLAPAAGALAIGRIDLLSLPLLASATVNLPLRRMQVAGMVFQSSFIITQVQATTLQYAQFYEAIYGDEDLAASVPIHPNVDLTFITLSSPSAEQSMPTKIFYRNSAVVPSGGTSEVNAIRFVNNPTKRIRIKRSFTDSQSICAICNVKNPGPAVIQTSWTISGAIYYRASF